MACQKKHDNYYKYDIDKQGEYINIRKTRMIVDCIKHGSFDVSVKNHMYAGKGCIECWNERRGETRRLTWEEILKDCKQIHNNKYKYNIDKQPTYVNVMDTVIIVECPIHGDFEIKVGKHKYASEGCRQCSFDRKGNDKRLGWEEVFKRCNAIHGDLYEYSLNKQVKYENTYTSMVVDCKIHGEFITNYNIHYYSKCNCPECVSERFESEAISIIRGLLEKWNIYYEVDVAFDGLMYKKSLYVDIVLEDGRWIEYDGKQHFVSTKHWGGEEALKLCKIRDAVKDKFAKDNDIKLIRIPYWEKDNLEDILIKELKL